jgi:uracil phosphoribosyltransferase
MTNIKNVLMTTLRNKQTSMKVFRETADRLAHILAQESTQYIKTKSITIETPLKPARGITFDTHVVLIPILRSGLALLPAFLEYYPDASVGFVGLKRDEETAIAKQYYQNLPPIQPNDQIIILDPMLATGGSTAATIEILLNQGITQEQMLFVGVICAQEGLEHIQKRFPQLHIIIAAHDPILNNKKFIEPGLGDFGDRFFGTL